MSKDSDKKVQTTTNKLKVRLGKCHSCGKDVENYICICSDCTKKGITHKSLGIKMCKE